MAEHLRSGVCGIGRVAAGQQAQCLQASLAEAVRAVVGQRPDAECGGECENVCRAAVQRDRLRPRLTVACFAFGQLFPGSFPLFFGGGMAVLVQDGDGGDPAAFDPTPDAAFQAPGGTFIENDLQHKTLLRA